MLELDLKTSRQVAESTIDIDQKLVLLHSDDASAVDVREDEPVLLIISEGRYYDQLHNSDSLCAAICRAQILVDLKSPKKKKYGNVRQGEMLLMSHWFSKQLLAQSEASDADASISNDLNESFSTAQAAAVSSSPPSPSKQNFSFAKGGGGDALVSTQQKSTPSKSFSFAKRGGGGTFISPRNHSTPSSIKKSNTKNCNPSRKCLLVPIYHLSKKQLRHVCVDACELVLGPINNPLTESEINETSTKTMFPGFNSRNIIQTLIVSKYRGSCVSLSTSTCEKSEIVSIIFRGQIESFRIMNVAPQISREDEECTIADEVTHLSSAVHGLDVTDDIPAAAEYSNQIDAILKRIPKRCMSYRITPRTCIRFINGGDARITNKSISPYATTKAKLCAGLDATLSRIRDALLPPVLNPQLFPADGPLRPPKGVLLYGPAGVGKSLAAAQVASDISSESKKIYVQSVQCAELLASTGIVGEAENKLTRIFEDAEREANEFGGSLVILDDIHLICPRRGGNNGLGVDQLAGTLLALLDGIGTSKRNSKGGVFVLAITTDPSLLDPALRRSGRLDSEIEVPVPDDNARNEILAFHIAQLASPDIKDGFGDKELKTLARLAKGFTGADCKLAVKEAVRLSVKRNQPYVEYSDIEHGIRSIKPSAIKSIAVEVPHVPWSSIGGMQHVKSLLRESIELPLTHPHLFEMMKVPPPKGILLYGPPGCSKTLMARAIATEGQMNFLAVKGPELLSKWLGESERALASLFRRARLASPSVVFFDEVDAIAGKRGEGGGGGDRLLSQLLTELDGVATGGPGNKPCRVVVVGATNRPDTLDPALLRPGRMDRMIYVGLPDSDGRKSIFEIGLRGKACHDDVDLSILANDDNSEGYSGAELIAICRDAALRAIGEMIDGSPGAPQICMRHLLQSMEDLKPRTTKEMLDFYKSFRGQH